ncbi:MAG: N-6 DNA methylase [Cyanobacteriota bacterium]
MHKNTKFSLFLEKLGYLIEDKSIFEYSYFNKSVYQNNDYNSPTLDFYYLKKSSDFDNELFELHKKKWNKNSSNIFVVVSDEKTFVINAKIKPLKENSKIGIIIDFNYGVNSQDFSINDLEELRKKSFDNGFFWNFIIKQRNKIKENEVDKDLLLNLVYLKNCLLEISDNKNKDDIIHLVILRCLFIKYLEDRGFFETQSLVNILKTGNPEYLINEFEKLNHLFNGDIFEPQELKYNDINSDMLNLLERFFTSDFKTGQDKLFPYCFNLIPITLISNVYEAFLKNAHKQNDGIYYTPSHVVRFILEHTLKNKLKNNKRPKVLDVACGSGAFLVESLKMIFEAYERNLSFEEKKDILKDCIYGIDLDKKAIQISSFSLYLALLENQDKNSLKENQRRLPLLKNTNLIGGVNSLLEETKLDNLEFDCIIGNPPWGGMPNKTEKDILDKKNFKAKFGEKVGDYQRSQAFLLEVKRWSNKDTIIGLIVNNSNFYNDNSYNFRKEFLLNYQISYFYELSGINKILFKKQTIGNKKTGEIKLGANEPSAIVIFNTNKIDKDFSEHEILYTTPKLNNFSEYLKIISISNNDIKKIKQRYLLLPNQDDIWRIFVNGDWDDYNLIKKKNIESKDIFLHSCHKGFQPLKDEINLGSTDFRPLIEPNNFKQYYLEDKINTFDWNLKKSRDAKLAFFEGDKIIIKSEPMPEDNFKLKCVIINDKAIFKNNIFTVKIPDNINLKIALAILNSSFIGYYLYQTSSQWGKGKTRNTLRTEQITSLPFPLKINDQILGDRLIKLVDDITKAKIYHYKQNPSEKYSEFNNNKEIRDLEFEIDDIVFDLYRLKPFEKEIIRAFYNVNVFRKNDIVNKDDINAYVNKFRESFSFILKEDLYLNASCQISSNIGTMVCFDIVDKSYRNENILQLENTDLLKLVKNEELEKSISQNFIKEEKIKIYDSNRFYIIKSNLFKDWTLREAFKDSKEEIAEVIKNLPKE